MTVTHTVEVPVERLDAVLPSLRPDHATRRIHLKIDTQGTDLDVFRGATGVLPHVASLQIELGMFALYEAHTPFGVAFTAIDAAGYDCTGIYPVTRHDGHRVIDADCLFRRRMPARAVAGARHVR
jgi:hypothetical protein